MIKYMVTFSEPYKNTNIPVHRWYTVDEAINMAKENAKLRNYTYKSDNDALLDFMTVHRAGIDWINLDE